MCIIVTEDITKKIPRNKEKKTKENRKSTYIKCYQKKISVVFLNKEKKQI